MCLHKAFILFPRMWPQWRYLAEFKMIVPPSQMWNVQNVGIRSLKQCRLPKIVKTSRACPSQLERSGKSDCLRQTILFFVKLQTLVRITRGTLCSPCCDNKRLLKRPALKWQIPFCKSLSPVVDKTVYSSGWVQCAAWRSHIMLVFILTCPKCKQNYIQHL